MDYARLGLCAGMMLLAACGGGGDGGGGGDSNGQPAVTLSTNTLSFESQQYSALIPASQTITATARSGSVFIDLAGYSFASVSCPGTSQCAIQVRAPSTNPPPQPGVYNYTLSVRICSDAFCNSVIRTETVAIRHTVTPGVQLTATPGTVELTADQGQTAVQSLALSFANGTPTSISAVATYPAGNGSGWLTVNPTLSTVGISATVLAPETYQASIALTYSGPGYTNTVDIPVTYTIRPQPSVEHVVPRVGIENEALTVVIRGRGFDRMTYPVRFGGIAAQQVTKISDTELLVTPPSFATAGDYTVDIPNDHAIATGTARFTVVAPQPYAAAELDIADATNSGLAYKQVIYDAQRRAVYFTKDVRGPSRARFESGAWVIDSLATSMCCRMSSSTDGSKLYFMDGTAANEYDLDQDSVIKTFPDVAASGSFDEVVILNDGQALTHRMGRARLTNLALGRTSELTFGPMYTRYSVASADLGKVLLLQESANQKFAAFDASTRAFTELAAATNVGVSQVALNRHGTRIIAAGNVYDGNYALLGSLAGWTGATGITTSPDGTKAYVIGYVTTPTRRTELQVFDLSGATGPYPQVGPTIVLPSFSGYAPAIAIAPDGLTLFIVGNERFIVMPAPVL